MNLPSPIAKYLEKRKIKYQIVSHRQVFTAFDKAATLKIKPAFIGKTLILKGNSSLFLALIPGDRNLDKNKFKKLVNNWRKKESLRIIKDLDFLPEKLIIKKFKGAKVGAIPPFGELWGLPTFVDRSLINQPKLIINGGDYNFSIKITSTALKKAIPNFIGGHFTKIRK